MSIRTRLLLPTVVTLLVAAASLARVGAQTPVESSNETRFQLDLKVSDAVIASRIPPGFTLNVAAQGPAKDVNLRVVFSDRVTIHGPDRRPLGRGSNRLAYLIVPVRDAAGNVSQLVIGGLTEDPSDAPGPFGTYLAATTHTMQRSTVNPATGTGPILETQDWVFAAATGERLEMHVKYERGVPNRAAPAEVRFYSGKTPSFFQISRQELALDIVKNVTTTPADRVKEFSFKGSGGSFAPIFDGTEKLLSWDNIMWIDRTVLVP